MTRRQDITGEPFRFDFFDTLREFERSRPDKPRIGDNAVRSDEIVRLGQDPFLEFPDSNISELATAADGAPRLMSRFLGFFGPQGALPLNTTIEAYQWSQGRDTSFVRFVNMFANRFLQLFFRAWADARPAAQHDRPTADRFSAFVGSFIGLGTPASLGRDGIPDIGKLRLAGIASAGVKSASGLQRFIEGLLDVKLSVHEHVGTWLTFEPEDRSMLGGTGSRLGDDAMLGERLFSINDKFRISIRTNELSRYESLLPGGTFAGQLADAVFFYLGYRFDWDVELALPAHLAPPARLGEYGKLGWTAWLAPGPAEAGAYRNDARFELRRRD